MTKTKEILLKYVNNVKETNDNELFEIMKPFTVDELTEHMKETVESIQENNKKKFKFEIITGIYPNKFKRYYIDDDMNKHIEDCLINVNAKVTKNKSLTFDEKIELFKEFVRINKREPHPGDIINGFDIGKFYNTALVGKKRGEQVDEILERFTKN